MYTIITVVVEKSLSQQSILLCCDQSVHVACFDPNSSSVGNNSVVSSRRLLAFYDVATHTTVARTTYHATTRELYLRPTIRYQRQPSPLPPLPLTITFPALLELFCRNVAGRPPSSIARCGRMPSPTPPPMRICRRWCCGSRGT